jgi:hypothetical protein
MDFALRRHHARQRLQRAGLAGAVGADQADLLAFLDIKDRCP